MGEQSRPPHVKGIGSLAPAPPGVRHMVWPHTHPAELQFYTFTVSIHSTEAGKKGMLSRRAPAPFDGLARMVVLLVRLLHDHHLFLFLLLLPPAPLLSSSLACRFIARGRQNQ